MGRGEWKGNREGRGKEKQGGERRVNRWPYWCDAEGLKGDGREARAGGKNREESSGVGEVNPWPSLAHC